MLDNITDVASKLAHEVLQDTLLDKKEGWNLAYSMEALRRKEEGFTYRVSLGDDGKPDGIVWMTPTMRAALNSLDGLFVWML
ncbi:MAG: hypothetical protein ACREOZ_00105 [Gloeomargaritales cyanobacterium]